MAFRERPDLHGCLTVSFVSHRQHLLAAQTPRVELVTIIHRHTALGAHISVRNQVRALGHLEPQAR